LRALHRRESEGGEPPRVTELGSLVLVRPPSISGVVDRLERVGWVEKLPSAGDQRSRHVRLTEAGRARVRRVLEDHAEWVASLAAGLAKVEQARLLHLLHKLNARLGSMTDGAPEPSAARRRKDSP